MRADHPARYGLDGEAYHAMIGLWWGEQLVGLRLHAGKRRGGG